MLTTMLDSKQKTFVFIFARGGSKGLPRKNVLPIGGFPLIVHSIHTAQALEDIAGIFVSTDCQEIASIAGAAGAEIISRPDELASDTASEWLAWQHAIRWVKAKYGDFDRFLSLPPTAPCRCVSDVKRCLKALNPNVDLVLTMAPSHRSPWFNMVTEDSEGRLELVKSEKAIQRRQDSPSCFDIATVAYAANPTYILKSSSIWEGKVCGIKIKPEHAIDIDNHVDYAIARFLKEQYLPNLEGADNA